MLIKFINMTKSAVTGWGGADSTRRYCKQNMLLRPRYTCVQQAKTSVTFIVKQAGNVESYCSSSSLFFSPLPLSVGGSILIVTTSCSTRRHAAHLHLLAKITNSAETSRRVGKLGCSVKSDHIRNYI